MRVLYVAPNFPNEGKNAAQVRANQLLARLAQEVDLHVLGFSRRISEVTEDVFCFPVHICDPSQPSPLSLFSRFPVAFSRYASRKGKEAFLKLAKELQPDIVHLDSIATFGLLSCLPSQERAKIVLQPHDAVSRLYERQLKATGGLLQKAYLKRQHTLIKVIEKTFYPKADLVLVDSAEDAMLLDSVAEEVNVDVLPLGYDERVFTPDGPQAKAAHPNVVMTGALGGIQSIDAAKRLCEKIMPLVWESRPDVHVYLVGSSPAPEIKALAKRDERIHVTGFVNDLASWLRAADVFACPLILGSGMRTRTIEALACGCAMVTFPEGVVGINNSGNSLAWREVRSVEAFSAEIVQLLDKNNRNLLVSIKKNARSIANKYTWSNIAKSLIGKYSEIL